MFHHDYQREVVLQLRRACYPGILRNSAYAGTTGIHEKSATLDIDRPTLEIVRCGRLLTGRRAIGKLGIDLPVVVGGAA
jgi:hypothetical protein